MKSDKPEKETTAFARDYNEPEVLPVIDGELIADSDGEKSVSTSTNRLSIEAARRGDAIDANAVRQTAVRDYILLPFVFLTVALLGGLRVASADDALVFLKPPLACLIFAALLLVLFFRTRLLRLDGWFSESFSTVKNVANALILLTLFAASTQIFNSLLPESGLPFWVFAFCFFWTLLNNLFSVFDAKKLVQSLGGLFGFAFVVKYLVLARLTAPAAESWWRSLLENPAQEVLTTLLDLPRFAPATGYIQFFGVIFYLLGLFLLSPASLKTEK